MGAGVAPGFEKVRFRDVPVAEFRRFVVVQAEVDAVAYFVECRSKVEVHGRVVHRIAAEDEQGLDLPGVHSGN